MPKHLITFLLLSPQQVTVETEGDDLPFLIRDGVFTIFDKGKQMVAMGEDAFLRCELVPDEPAILKPRAV